MTNCIFCDALLDRGNKPEHILLDALGGRMTTRLAICSECNNIFGNTIDKELASQVAQIRNLMHFKSGSGDPPPTIRNIQSGNDRLTVYGDGEMRLQRKPFEVQELGDGKWNVSINVSTHDELERIIPHIAAKLKIPESKLREQLAGANVSLIEQRPEVIRLMNGLGGPEAIRSIVKAGLVLWSTLTGNDELKSAPFDAARNFVLNGDDAFLHANTDIDSRIHEDVERMKSGYGPLFNLLYLRSDDKGRVVGHFTLYNLLGWHFTLAQAGGSPNKKLALISNPETPAIWSNVAAEQFDVSFAWLCKPDYPDDFVRAQSRFSAMMERYFELAAPKAREAIVEDCFSQLQLEPNAPIPLEKAQILSKMIAERVTAHTFGLKHEEKMTFDELLKRKKLD